MAARIRPANFVWTEQGHMVPLPGFRKQCDEQFLIGETYPLTILDARSRVSHDHFFASVHEGFLNLPEGHHFIDEHHLRKWALIDAGYCSIKEFVCESDEHALALSLNKQIDKYAMVHLHGNIVRIFEADSQSAAAMGREVFQKSKDAVFQYIAAQIGSTLKDLRRAGAQHYPEPKRNTR